MTFIRLELYLIVNSCGPRYDITFKILVLFLNNIHCINNNNHNYMYSQSVYTNNVTILSISLIFITILCCILSIFSITFGSINYWSTHKINNGDGAAFIGYTLLY